MWRVPALRSLRLTVPLLTVPLLGALLVAAGPGSSAGEPGPDVVPPLPTVPGLPIVSLPTDRLVPSYTGGPARERPMPAAHLPQHPFLAPNGSSSMHNDSYSSDAYAVSGPLGHDPVVESASYGIRECATITFDSQGRILGLCGGVEGFTMMLIDPETLQPISQRVVSERDLTSGANPLTDICGGTYFYLDERDRAFATTTDSSIAQLQVVDDEVVEKRRWPVADALPEGDCLVATAPDWSGRTWVFSKQGHAGTLDRRTGKVRLRRLGGPEEGIFNSVSADETGGVFAVSTHAMYRLEADRRGRPLVTWRREYDRGSRLKPGMLSQGSGTSPTLLGRRWVGLTDNADPRTRLLVLDRHTGEQRCAVPVFEAGASTTENSLVAAGRGFVIENNYGYSGVPATMLGRTTTPGVARVVLTRGGGCRLAWTNDTVAPTSVPKASLGNGLVYVYSKPARDDGIDAWYLTAIDLRSGRTAWSRLTGTGTQWNNHYAAIYLGPDGAAYVATLTGLVRVTDGARP